jgi:hypothetical protein
LLNLKNANVEKQLSQEPLTLILIVFVANVVIRYSSVKVAYNGGCYTMVGTSTP